MAHVGHIHAVTLVEFLLERQDNQHFIHRLLNLTHTAAFPCPHLRRDVIEHLETLFVTEVGNAKIETRVIHQNHHIRLIVNNILLALGNIVQHLPQVDRHLHEAHVGHRAVMLQQVNALRLHQVAATAAKFGFLVLFLDFGHKIGGVHVARSLTCYDIVFHWITIY